MTLAMVVPSSASLKRKRPPIHRRPQGSWSLEVAVTVLLAAQVFLCLVLPSEPPHTCQPTTVVIPRAFPTKKTPLLCQDSEPAWKLEQNTPLTTRTAGGGAGETGLLYHAIPNTDNDVVASVAVRIAPPGRCRIRIAPTRKFAHEMEYNRRNHDKSLLLAFVRDPTTKAILDFFRYQVSERKWDPTDIFFRDFLDASPGRYDNRYLQELSLNEYLYTNSQSEQEEVVKSILHDYDFVGVTERLEESLVVLKLLMGLKLSQITHVADPGPFHFFVDTCVYQIEPFVSPNMTNYFSSNEWQSRIQGDVLLHQAANQSLDKTVAKLGKSRVQTQLYRYQQAMDLVMKECADTRFPCDDDGVHNKHTDCLLGNSGCGQSCLDRIAAQIDKLDR